MRAYEVMMNDLPAGYINRQLSKSYTDVIHTLYVTNSWVGLPRTSVGANIITVMPVVAHCSTQNKWIKKKHWAKQTGNRNTIDVAGRFHYYTPPFQLMTNFFSKI